MNNYIENNLRDFNIRTTSLFRVGKISNRVDDLVDIIHKDIWYRIRNVRVAMEGEGYKVGDVLSIVPELPKDHEGNPIYDMADVIMNDVILIRVKEVVDGKKVTVFDEVEKEIKKDLPSRLHARRQMLKVLYPVTVQAENGKKKAAKKVDLCAKLFDEIAPKYATRNGGYTRIIKIGQRKGDGAMEVVLELV